MTYYEKCCELVALYVAVQLKNQYVAMNSVVSLCRLYSFCNNT